MKNNLKMIIPIIILVIFITSISIYYCFNYSVNNNEIVIEEEKELKNNKEEEKKEEEIYYYVDIKGAITSPGVYKLKENSRVIDVINEAGGLKEEADTSTINLSKKIKDEMFIIIYTKEEIDKYKKDTISTSVINKKLEKDIPKIDENNDANIVTTSDNKTSNLEENKLININTSTKEELLTLPSIGSSKADSIIKYRQENGNFEKIEDIKNVSGIGDSLFEKIKDYITV